MKLVFTRHAPTKTNLDMETQGKDEDILPESINLINNFIDKLKGRKFDLIISSDLKRAKSTAEKISQKLNLGIIYDALLREKDNGSFVGKKHGTFRWEDFGDDIETRKPPGGESLIELRERCIKFIGKINKKYKKKSILVVTHGAFLKILFGYLLNMSIEDSIFKLKINHCSFSEVYFNNLKDYKVTVINGEKVSQNINFS